VSEQNQPRFPQIRIVHHPDGTAEVNGVIVWPQPGVDVRDAAYAAAVALVANAPGPVLATSVEADGTVYPLTLYPAPIPFPADEAYTAGGRRGGRRARSGLGLLRRGGGMGLARLPTLRLGWLLTAVIGCVLVAVMAAVLLERDDPSLVRLSVDQQNEELASAQPQSSSTATQPDAAQAAGQAPGPLAPGEPGRAVGARGPSGLVAAGANGAASGTAAQAGQTGGAPTPSATAPSHTASGGTSQTPDAQPVPPGSARPKPTSTGPLAVTGLALVLVGGNKTEPDLDFLMTVSASGPGPVMLTYSYAGSKGGAVVTRRLKLSGETEYAVPGQIAAKSYCGQTVTMHATSSPGAANGRVSAAATPGC
jgi:hypothetical protein